MESYRMLDFIYEILQADPKIRLTSSRMHKFDLEGTKINVIRSIGSTYSFTIPDHILCGVLTTPDSYSFGIGQKTQLDLPGCPTLHLQWGMGSTDSYDLKFYLGCYLPQVKAEFKKWLYGPPIQYRKLKNIVV